METISIILSVITLIVLVAFSFLFKSYLSSYFVKKGENLATKEDIDKITRLTETVQNEFKREFEDYTKDRRFKNQYYYEQFSKLYTKLYCIIVQSEYLRHFYKLYNGSDFLFDDEPFIELHGKRTTTAISDSIKRTETDIQNDITEFNKEAIFNTIINNGEYASQRLLKLAVAYRFVHKHYEGTDPTSDVVKTANDEEYTLIKEIICCIIKEYNTLRSELKLDFIESELSTGLFDNADIVNVREGIKKSCFPE